MKDIRPQVGIRRESDHQMSHARHASDVVFTPQGAPRAVRREITRQAPRAASQVGCAALRVSELLLVCIYKLYIYGFLCMHILCIYIYSTFEPDTASDDLSFYAGLTLSRN